MCLICILCEVDEEFLFYYILCRFFYTGLKKLIKQQMRVVFTKHTKILSCRKNISLIICSLGVGGRRVIVGKY